MPSEESSQPAESRVMMWLALLAVVAAVAVSVLVSPRAGLLLLSGVLAVFAILRAVSPRPLYGIASRSRAFDVTLMLAAAVLIAGVTLSLPTSALG